MAKPIKIEGMKRYNLYEKFAQDGYKIGAEIGVFKGYNARQMFRAIPELKLYCVDCWKPARKRGKERQKKYYKVAKHALRQQRKDGNAIIIKKYSLDAVRDFEDGQLDFVYIDASHTFDDVIQDIIYWSAKVRKGGIVSGHDYFKAHRFGVVTAVDAYTKSHRINPWYITDNEFDHKSRSRNSFFWVK